MKLIGLTGGVACGKTTVAGIFEKQGYPVIDADAVAREMLSGNAEVGAKVEKEFGTKDRMKLREIIFGDIDKRVILERILHPVIGDEIQERVGEMAHRKPAPKAVVVVVPLLFEASWEKLVDFTIAVVSQKKSQLSRLKKRDEIGENLAQKMVGTQLPNDEKAKRATYVIHNDGSLKDLEKSVKKLISEIEKRPA